MFFSLLSILLILATQSVNANQLGEGMAAYTPISVLVKNGGGVQEILIVGANIGLGSCDSIMYEYEVRSTTKKRKERLCTSKRLTIGYSYLLMRTPTNLRWAFDEERERLFLIVPKQGYDHIPASEFVMDGYVCLPYTYTLPGKELSDDGQCGRWDLRYDEPAYKRYELSEARLLMH